MDINQNDTIAIEFLESKQNNWHLN